MALNIFILENTIDEFPRVRIQDTLAKRYHNITIARSYIEAGKIYDPPYDLLLLNHDLGGDKTGYDFVRWLVLQAPQLNPPDVIIHSHNTVGATNMRWLLERYGYEVAVIPFSLKYVDILSRI